MSSFAPPLFFIVRESIRFRVACITPYITFLSFHSSLYLCAGYIVTNPETNDHFGDFFFRIEINLNDLGFALLTSTVSYGGILFCQNNCIPLIYIH